MSVDKSTVIQNAQRYTAKGQIEKAIEEWQKLIAETPNDGNIYNTIGDLYLKNNSSKEAIEIYLKAAEAFNKAGFALKTIAVYKKIIKIDPLQMEAYVKLADLHAERGLTGNAIEDYMKVAKQYAKQGKVRESLDIYRKIANLDPTNVNIQIKLSELCLKEGLKTEALEQLLKAAQNCSIQGKTQEADRLYACVLQIDPYHEAARSRIKDPSALGGMVSPKSPPGRVIEAHPVMEQNDLDQEEKSLREVLTRPEATTAQRQKLGYILLKKGDLEGALHEFQQAVQEYHHDHEWGQAIQVMQDYLRKDPKRLEAHDLLAQSYEKSGLIDRALEEYVTVIDLMIREEHSMTEAMELFNRIKELDPQNPVVEKLTIRFGPYMDPDSKPALGGQESSFPFSTLISSDTSASGGGSSEGASGSGGKEVIQSYLTEAGVYLKYGLSGKALEQLHTAVKLAPDHPEVHQRLKEVYRIEGKFPEVIAECLELARIYEQSQQQDQRRQVLEEALALDPDNSQIKSLLDPSADRPSPQAKEKTGSEQTQSKKSLNTKSTPQSPPLTEFSSRAGGFFNEQISTRQSTKNISLGPKELTPAISREAEEQFAEAEFYLQQGLKEEAKKLYQQVLALKPSHLQAKTRLSEMQLEPSGSLASGELAKGVDPPAQPQGQKLLPPTHDEGNVNLAEMFMEELEDKSEPVKSAPIDPAQQELESLFHEFKKGIQAQFGDQDYETHYNLGIAYKEMGLFKEAIEEFHLALKGQAMFIDASSMIAVCYKEEGDYEHAVQQLQAVLKDERCSGGHAVGLKYELAQLYELMDRKKEALELFAEIYGVDKTFKDVVQRLKNLKGVVPDMAQAGATAQSTKEYTAKDKTVKKKKVSYL